MTDYAEILGKKLKPEWKTALAAALVIGLAAHMYKFTNTLPNHDAILSVYSSNNMIESGRWFLEAASAPGSFFDLPWLNGLLSLLWLGISAAIIADIFRLKTKHCIILAAGLLVSFPCITNTFFFEFTADGYMLAMLLAALGVRLSLPGDNKPLHLAAAALCICLSCGIYQAYVSFALILAVCRFMTELFENKRENREYLRWILNQIIIFSAAMAAYLIIWKLCMHAQNASAGSYLGMDSLGQQGAGAGFAAAIMNMLKGMSQFFLSRNVFRYGWTWYAVFNAAFLLLGAVLIIRAAQLSGIYKKPLSMLLLLLCLISVPFFAFIWFFISKNVHYHLLMLQSFSIIYIFVLILSQRYLKGGFRAAAALFFALVVFRFTVQANASYFEMDKCCARTEIMAAEMCTRVHAADEGNVDSIAIIGNDEMNVSLSEEGRVDELLVNAYQIHHRLIFNHLYGTAYLRNFSGLEYAPVSDERLEELENDSRVKEMPDWPLKGSVEVIDGTAVIKLNDNTGAA